MPDIVFVDEPFQGNQRRELLLDAKFSKIVRIQWLPDGTKYTEFANGSVLVQTPFHEDRWLSKAQEKSK